MKYRAFPFVGQQIRSFELFVIIVITLLNLTSDSCSVIDS
jgi:hypothetical protein